MSLHQEALALDNPVPHGKLQDPRPCEEGEYVIFRPHDKRNLTVEGQAVAVQETSGGSWRVRVRTSQRSPQDDGFLTWTTYTNTGTYQRITDPIPVQ